MTDPFDAVIQRITYEATKAPRAYGQRLAIIDPRSGEVFLDSLPFLKRHRASAFRYYLASTNGKANCRQREAAITDFSGKPRNVAFVVSVTGIVDNRMKEVVSALAKENTPVDGLVVHVGRWLQEFADHKHGEKIFSVARLTEAFKIECGKFVTDKASQQLGLHLTCTVRLPEEDLKMPPYDIQLTILVHDVEDELQSRIELIVEPPDSPGLRNKALASIVSVEEFREQIERRVKHWFRQQCTLEQFCYQTIKVRDSLEQELRKYVEDDLSLVLFGLRVTCKPPAFETKFPSNVDLTVESTIEPAQTKIQVHHKLLLNRENIAVFRNARVPDLKMRIEELLEGHTRAVFFAKKYVEVIVGFDSLRTEIKTRVENEVKSLGFIATQLTTIPNEEQMQRIIEGSFSFDTSLPDKPSEGGGDGAVKKEDPLCTFGTKDSRVKFGLSIQARVRLKNLELVKSFLHPKTDLRDNFKQVAREAAAEAIRKLTPEDLYIKFSESASADESPESTIRQAVEKLLSKNFNAIVENITLTSEETDLTQLYSAMRPAGSHRFDLTFQTLGSTGEQFVFHIDYRILGIAEKGWPIFQEMNNNTEATDISGRAKEIVQALNQFLRNATIPTLQLMPPDLLRSANFRAVEGVRKVFDDAVERVSERFGLQMEIVGRHRELTPWEFEEQKSAREEHEALKRQLMALEAKYETLQADLPPDDPILKELSEKIKTSREHLKSFAPDHNEHFNQIKQQLRQLPAMGIDLYLPPPGRSDDGGRANESRG